MNIFENVNEFLGEIHPEGLKTALSEFYTAVAEIKERLGHNAELLREYIVLVFGAICEVNMETSATDGFSCSMPELKRLCGSIVRGESGCEDHPLYEQAKRYICSNPLPHMKRLYKIEVYAGALMGDYSEYMIETYYKKYIGRLDNGNYITDIKLLYNEICRVLGSEDAMEQFNQIVKNNFILVPFMPSFLQSVIDHMLDVLSFKVPGTAKYVFDMVPDMDEGGVDK
jgi:hypothetical protein